MAERSRVNSSTAAVMASGGSAGFNRSNAARKRDTNCHGPAKLREQRYGGLLDKLILGVGVRAHWRT